MCWMSSSPLHTYHRFLLIVPLLPMSGCGSDFAKVTGTVRMDGEPIAGGERVRGTVYFYPEMSTGAPAVGLLDSSGKYTLTTGSHQGIRPGTYKVTIRATQLIPSRIKGEAPGGRPMTPPLYADPRNSPFRVEVQPGSNELDFDLQSQPSKG